MRDLSSPSLSLTLHILISVFWNAQAGTMASLDQSLSLDADTRRYFFTPNSCPSSPATVDVGRPIALGLTCEIPYQSPRYARSDCSENPQPISSLFLNQRRLSLSLLPSLDLTGRAPKTNPPETTICTRGPLLPRTGYTTAPGRVRRAAATNPRSSSANTTKSLTLT
ncbi:hypothetical protein EDB81DRAFT_921260 [Dactylonectria macrodidyma]|uniref:Uncharacterized protein n=1 Tax=Dactylonectria macrodidyma TaxID=307937 RepID=A0A9P9D7R2_9HYPO|nr:hypothetical protein EDB81DRAFT_921260 [Dactylonectria macrodidyma]